jgi:proteic killer suppression protein
VTVEYKSEKLRRLCEDAEQATKKFGDGMARLLHQRIDQIRAAPSVDILLLHRVGGCHILQGDRKGQMAMKLLGAQRLIFIKKQESTVEVQIVDICDYH